MSELSPFLHRDPDQPRYVYAPDEQSYRARITKTPWEQRLLIEELRYKGYVRRGTLGSTMQVLGDFGRAWALPLAIIYFGYMLSWYW